LQVPPLRYHQVHEQRQQQERQRDQHT
jgi:hypothetical protein